MRIVALVNEKLNGAKVYEIRARWSMNRWIGAYLEDRKTHLENVRACRAELARFCVVLECSRVVPDLPMEVS